MRAMPRECGTMEFHQGLQRVGFSKPRRKASQPCSFGPHSACVLCNAQNAGNQTQNWAGKFQDAASAARALGLARRSLPTLELAGNTSDLITTTTAPEVSRMAPISM